MSTIGIQRVTAVIEFVIDYQPAVVTLLTPFPDVDMLLGRREQAVVLLHQSLHAGTHSRGIYYSLHTLGAHIQYVERRGDTYPSMITTLCKADFTRFSKAARAV